MINMNDIKDKLKLNSLFLPFYLAVFFLLASCARMGQPDGGFPKELQSYVLKGQEPITVRP